MAAVTGSWGTYVVEKDELSRGGVGSIHRTNDPDFVFKRYFDPARAPARSDLERLVEVGREVLIRQRRRPGETPDSSVNWPVDISIDQHGAVTGVLLPIIPRVLFHEEFGGVRTLDFLVMARAKPPTAKGRIVLLLRMAEIFNFVNARGLVHGDVNGKNLAWAVQPQPVMYLIDCDGMVPQQPAPKAGVQAMGWTDPRVVERRIPAHDHYSDWYALALAMYRGLLLTPGRLDRAADGSWPSPRKIPNGFPAQLADLVRRGLEPTAADRRPPPDEWVRALREIYLPNNRFDDAAIATLDAMSAPVKKTPPRTFTPVPATDWTATVRPAPTAPATGRQPMSPPRQPPRPGPPYQPPRAGPRYQGSPPPPPYPNPRPGPPYPQPPPYRPPGTGPYYQQPAPPPYRTGPAMPPNPYRAPGYGQQYRQPGPPTGGVPTDAIALAALRGGGRWYAFGVLAALFPIGGLTYTVIGLVQLRHVDGAYPGALQARRALIAFTVFYFLEMILLISLQALTRRT